MTIQVVYASLADHDFSDDELAALLHGAVRNNARMNLTGLLLYANGSFLQVLEGDEATVDALMERIRADPRHHSIEYLLRSTIRYREFSQWHMGFKRVQADDAVACPQYAAFFEDGFDPAVIGARPGASLDILKALASHMA